MKPSATSWSSASTPCRTRYCKLRVVPANAGRREENLLFVLRLVPERVHLGERSALERAPLRGQRALDVAEAAFEFGVGAAQREFGIGADMPRQVDQREQKIAGF